MRAKSDMYCEWCRCWTPLERAVTSARCSTCGNHYQCGECGAEVDVAGNCLRFESEPGLPRCRGERELRIVRVPVTAGRWVAFAWDANRNRVSGLANTPPFPAGSLKEACRMVREMHLQQR